MTRFKITVFIPGIVDIENSTLGDLLEYLYEHPSCVEKVKVK